MEREKRVPMSVCERGGPRSVGSGTCALASYYNCTNAASDLNCYKDCWFPESPRTTRMSRAQQNAWEGGQSLSYILYVHHLYPSLQKPSCVHSKKKKSPALYVSIIPFTDKETKTQTKKQMELTLASSEHYF